MDVEVINLGPSHVLVKSWCFRPRKLAAAGPDDHFRQVYLPLDTDLLLGPGEVRKVAVGSIAGRWFAKYGEANPTIFSTVMDLITGRPAELVLRCFDVTGERLVRVELQRLQVINPHVPETAHIQYRLHLDPSVW